MSNGLRLECLNIPLRACDGEVVLTPVRHNAPFFSVFTSATTDSIQDEPNGIEIWLVDDALRQLRWAAPKKVWWSRYSPNQTLVGRLLRQELGGEVQHLVLVG